MCIAVSAACILDIPNEISFAGDDAAKLYGITGFDYTYPVN
jgi:hypothetical protein